jgi:hypothetical protein
VGAASVRGVPNGVDKNFRRLLMACAAYRQEHGEWPAQARLHPALMQDLARLFDGDDFARLAARLELRTRERVGLSVGGRGVVEYGEVDHDRFDDELLVRAETWLGVTPRRE